MSKRRRPERYDSPDAFCRAHPTVFYSGDCGIEHGGYFYTLENWEHEYVDCVEVCEGEGHEGDYTNYVSRGCINIKLDDLESALTCCGFETDGEEIWGNCTEQGEGWKKGSDEWKHVVIECMKGYWGIEVSEDFQGRAEDHILIDPEYSTNWNGISMSSDDLLGFVLRKVRQEFQLS